MIRCEWGPAAAGADAAVAIVIDVLSFSTAVVVAVGRGAEILPYPFADHRLAAFAARMGATAAGRRGAAGFSLSPATMRAACPGQRIVLASPNGAVVTHAQTAPVVLAGCLRNATAVARAATAAGGDILLVPAGERWPDGSLRPAIEDLLGAGAIACCLPGPRSPETRAAEAAFREAAADLPARVVDSVSGRELIGRGHAEDVAIAAALDCEDVVPRLARDDLSAAPPVLRYRGGEAGDPA